MWWTWRLYLAQEKALFELQCQRTIAVSLIFLSRIHVILRNRNSESQDSQISARCSAFSLDIEMGRDLQSGIHLRATTASQ